jgi:hypothetical protein
MKSDYSELSYLPELMASLITPALLLELVLRCWMALWLRGDGKILEDPSSAPSS